MRRNAALRAAKRGDTAAALDIAKNPAEAMQAVARGQGNAAFVDLYLEGALSSHWRHAAVHVHRWV